ncbi:MAG: SH3 domain-containing protein [Pseudomonadota bacterium]
MTHLTKALFTALPATALATALAAQSLDVPVMERADEDLDTCAYGKVTGLKADGDGFLAVRSGPGTQFAKIDELVNEDEVWLFEQRGKWIGIAYGTPYVNCSPISSDRELQTDGKKGWVHENWIVVMAG